MYSVTVSDSVMIAHSLEGEVFGPAQRLHGATFVVEVEMRRADVDRHGIVADIGRAIELLQDVLEPIAYRNLDDVPSYAGKNTTTEFLARETFDRYADGVRAGRLEGDSATAITSLKVTLREKPTAWASFEGPLL